MFFFTNVQLFVSQDVDDWSGVDYCGALSAVWTLILTAPIHCTPLMSDLMLNFSKSVLMNNKHILDGLRVSTFSTI